MVEKIGFGLYHSRRNRGSVDVCFGCGGVGGIGGEWVWGFDPGRVGCCYVCVSCESGFSM